MNKNLDLRVWKGTILLREHMAFYMTGRMERILWKGVNDGAEWLVTKWNPREL